VGAEVVDEQVAETSSLENPVVVAPDGSLLRPLGRIEGAASLAHFELAPGAVSRAVSHATVQEIWYVVAGEGLLWRRYAGRAETVPLCAGVCVTIPLGTAFQFRAAERGESLRIVCATVPPWPEGSTTEARPERGPWAPDSGGSQL
jgi:mannose-6-phosphate isomerase-like protein (cupin superfamily)